MPLSTEFSNSRLEYLKNNIKNTDTVSAQFYPRFQRQYNEMYPFTEGSNKIENPQQTVVSSCLNPPSLEMAKENLITYLIPYVGSNTESNFIINALTDVQIYYYEEHFNEIQKELLKIPTSKSSYLTNLRMVLNNDKNKSNLSIFEPPTTIPSTSSKRKIKRETIPAASSSSEEFDFADIRPRNFNNEGALNVRYGNRSDLLPDRIFAQNNPLSTVRTPITKPLSSLRLYPSSNRIHPDNPAFGIPHDEIIFRGRGIQSREIKHKKVFHKYAIDLKKLNHNILALKYLKNANNVATFHPIEISDTLKDLLNNFLYDGEQIDAPDFAKLSHTEKRILKRLYSFLKIDFEFDYDDQFQKRFQVMYGSWLAGNDNLELIKELKEHIKLAIHEAIISKQEGASMLHKLEK